VTTNPNTSTNSTSEQANGPFSRTTRVGRYQKGKTNLDFTEARGSEWQWHQLGHMQVCTPRSRQITTPAPHHSVFTGRMPFLSPNQQRQSTEGHTNSTNPTVISFAQTTCHSTRNKHKANDVSGSRMSVTSTAADVLISHIEQTDNTAESQQSLCTKHTHQCQQAESVSHVHYVQYIYCTLDLFSTAAFFAGLLSATHNVHCLS